MEGVAVQADPGTQATSMQTASDVSGSAATAGEKFSLGGAVLGSPAAGGHASADQQAPDAWLLCFAKHHADAAVWSGLFSSCRGGRDLALTHAGKAALTLRCADAEPDAGWTRQLAAVRQALSVREARPTRLAVRCRSLSASKALATNVTSEAARKDTDSAAGSSAQWLERLMLLPTQLSGVGNGVAELHVSHVPRGWCARPLLSLLAGACPNISSLVYRQCGVSEETFGLPPAAQWPRLRSLTIKDGFENGYEPIAQGLLQRVAPYVAQLVSLRIPKCSPGPEGEVWHHLFPPSPPPPTTLPLTHLSICDVLTDQLLSKLLNHAPNLKTLSVAGVNIHTEAYRDREWGVKQLVLSRGWRVESESVMMALPLLPKPQSARVSVSGDTHSFDIVFKIESDEGLGAALAERLALWHFDARNVTVQCCGVPPADQPAALGRTLRQLADMQAPDATVWLECWDWPAVADTIAECLPLLPHLRFYMYNTLELLTDELLAVILRMGPHMRRLSVYSLALQSDHTGVVRPWEELSVIKLDAAQLLRLPEPAQGAELQTRVVSLGMCTDLAEAECADISRILQSCVRGPDGQQHSVNFSLMGPNLEPQLRLLRASQLNLKGTGTLEIERCTMNPAIITLLSGGLTNRCKSLVFSDCEWPLPPEAYLELGRNLPVNYTSWRLRGSHTVEVAEWLCEGAVQRRREETCGAEWEPLCVYSDACGARQRVCSYGQSVSLDFLIC